MVLNLSVRLDFGTCTGRLSVYADDYTELCISYEIFIEHDSVLGTLSALDAFSQHAGTLAGDVYKLGVGGDLFEERQEMAGFWY